VLTWWLNNGNNVEGSLCGCIRDSIPPFY
jgi:hypothetical protein